MRRFTRKFYWDVIIAGLILLEAAFILWLPEEILWHGANEVGYTLCSFLIGLAVAARSWGIPLQPKVQPAQPMAWRRFGPAALLTVGMAAFAPFIALAFRETPATIEHSDIIPTIAVAVRRLLAGEAPYKTIVMNGGPQPLTYMPMQWLPYVVAELLRFDYRWVAAGIFYAASLATVWSCSRRSAARAFAVATMTLYLVWMLLNHNTGIIDSTVELMIAGYYMLLVMGIGGKNPWLSGAAIALCLLSRYSLVLWLPLWAFVEWMYADRKNLYRSALVIALLVAGIYVLPFLSRDWSTLGKGYTYYTEAAMGEWDNDGVPFQLNQGLGFARRFYLSNPAHSVAERLHLLQRVHLWVCAGSIALMSLAYTRLKKKLHPRIFLMVSFKIYLSLFLAFIQVPYAYLMITAVAVSIATFAELSSWQAANPADASRKS